MSKNLTHLSGRKGLEDNLFEAVGRLSEKTGTPDPDDLRSLAEWFHVGEANLYGTATFYDFTRPDNRGRQVYVCNGSACELAGTQPALRENLGRRFQKEEIGEMCCLGRCHENGAFQYQGQNYSARSPEEIAAILSEERLDGTDAYPVEAKGKAILTAPESSVDACRALIRQLLKNGPQWALDAIHASRLRGRGGAGFPLGIKMEGCRKAEGSPRFVVCNADEGDPGSYSDRYLLEQRPHRLLLGMLIAGYAIGAEWGVLYVRAEYPEAIGILEKAIAELQSAQLAGPAVLGSDFSFHFKIIKARGAYICGEETALLASIEGQRPEVRVRPPYPAQEGLFGKPTLVNNVETLACLPFILEKGGAAFASIGTEQSTGTKLISLDSHFRRPGLYEVEMGTPLETVVNELAGGFTTPVKALHIGGPLGGLVPASKVKDLTVDFESFKREGFLLGHASVVSIPDHYPMIAYLEHLFGFLAHESCGKCFPCRLGSVRGQELLQKAHTEKTPIDPQLFEDLLDTLERGSLCGLGAGAPLPVRNALRYFGEELRPFFGKMPDPGGITPS